MASPKLIRAQRLDKLTANERNPRKCSKRELERLRASLERHGHLGALVARRLPDGGLRLVSGHQRVQALTLLGHTTAPCWVLECSDQEETELLVQLNGHAGEWDDTALDAVLADLRAAGSDLEAIQIDAQALDRQLAEIRADLETMTNEEDNHGSETAPRQRRGKKTNGTIAQDDPARPSDGAVRGSGDASDPGEGQRLAAGEGSAAGEAGADDPVDGSAGSAPRWQTLSPRTRRGDVGQLGRHLLYVGDCTDAEAVTTALGLGGQRLLMLSDPPYSSGGYQEAGRAAGTFGEIANDALSSRGFQALLGKAIAAASCEAVYLFTDWRQWINLFDLLESSGQAVRSMIVWDKLSHGQGHIWRTRHELIAYACRSGKTRRRSMKGATGNVIPCPRSGNKHHYTEKPVKLLRQIIANDATSDRGTDPLVYDPFGGSGSTIIACEEEGRICRACEIEPRFADETILRWQEETSGTATRQADGATLAQIEEPAP